MPTDNTKKSMTVKVSLNPEEIREAITEYLSKRGFTVGDIKFEIRIVTQGYLSPQRVAVFEGCDASCLWYVEEGVK